MFMVACFVGENFERAGYQPVPWRLEGSPDAALVEQLSDASIGQAHFLGRLLGGYVGRSETGEARRNRRVSPVHEYSCLVEAWLAAGERFPFNYV